MAILGGGRKWSFWFSVEHLWKWSLLEAYCRQISSIPCMLSGFWLVRIFACWDFGLPEFWSCRDSGRVGNLTLSGFLVVGILGCLDFVRQDSDLSGLCQEPVLNNYEVVMKKYEEFLTLWSPWPYIYVHWPVVLFAEHL